eukprot:COSAG05_NODE_2236_length_3357_cov_5.705955_1_plen_42_part_10
MKTVRTVVVGAGLAVVAVLVIDLSRQGATPETPFQCHCTAGT